MIKLKGDDMEDKIREAFNIKQKSIRKSVALNNAVLFVTEIMKIQFVDTKDPLLLVINTAKEFEKYLKED